jgi:DNA-binding NarL/FixJ family response regulator
MRILLVDDHPLFLEGLRNLLGAHGVEVVGTARDGLEALEQARALRPEVILMDIQMPRCDGLSATRLIKSEFPEIKIVILTMSSSDQDLFDAIRYGAVGYLLKTLDTEEFFELLAGLSRGEVPLSPGIAARILSEFARRAEETATPSNASPAQTADCPEGRAAQAALSPRQVQILTLVSQGLLYKEVGKALGLSERTIKYHMGEIVQHLHLQSRAEIVAYARRHGILAN